MQKIVLQTDGVKHAFQYFQLKSTSVFFLYKMNERRIILNNSFSPFFVRNNTILDLFRKKIFAKK